MFLFNALLSLIGACFPASLHAQFLGYTSPQTVQVTLANAVACTGSNQVYKTGSVPGFFNLGQTQHTASIAYAGTVIGPNQMVIEGIDNQGNIFPISDVGMSASTNTVLTASGYFPQIQVLVLCPVGATFTLNYSGASSTPFQNTGAYQSAQIDKVITTGSSTASAGGATFQTPFGSTQGLLLFSYGGAGGSISISVACSGVSLGGGIPDTTFTFTPVTGTAGQVFQIPALQCPIVTVQTTTGGSTTYSLEYWFSPPGTPATVDPCASPATTKLSTPIAIASATSTIIAVPTQNNQQIYVCGFSLTEAGTTPTFKFEQATGALCVTSPTALSGTYAPVVGQPIVQSGPGTIFSAAANFNVCIVTGGTGPSLQGVVTFASQ